MRGKNYRSRFLQKKITLILTQNWSATVFPTEPTSKYCFATLIEGSFFDRKFSNGSPRLVSTPDRFYGLWRCQNAMGPPLITLVGQELRAFFISHTGPSVWVERSKIDLFTQIQIHQLCWPSELTDQSTTSYGSAWTLMRSNEHVRSPLELH